MTDGHGDSEPGWAQVPHPFGAALRRSQTLHVWSGPPAMNFLCIRRALLGKANSDAFGQARQRGIFCALRGSEG